jgi:hypothetical protein
LIPFRFRFSDWSPRPVPGSNAVQQDRAGFAGDFNGASGHADTFSLARNPLKRRYGRCGSVNDSKSGHALVYAIDCQLDRLIYARFVILFIENAINRNCCAALAIPVAFNYLQ